MTETVKLIMYLTRFRKIHPFIFIHGPLPKIFAQGILLLVYVLLDLILIKICDLQMPKLNFKTIIIRHLHMTKCHGQCMSTWRITLGSFMILMPTSKCSLAAAGSHFLPTFDCSFSFVKWSLVMCRIN